MSAGAGLIAAIHVGRGTFDLAVSLAVDAGQTLALLGPNGAGKSTALAALAGTLDADAAFSGTITLDDRVLDDETGHVEPHDRRVGVVFQDYLLFPHLTVLENVAFSARSRRIPRAAARVAATEWLHRLGVSDLWSLRPAQLSGGQAQRVALARALASDPGLLLLDEPLAALDVEVREDVRQQLAGHIRDWGGPTVVVTHSMEDVAALADEVVVVERGVVTQRGPLRSIVRDPATDWIRRLVARWAED